MRPLPRGLMGAYAGGSGIGGWLVATNEEDVSSSGDVLDAFKHGLSGIAE